MRSWNQTNEEYKRKSASLVGKFSSFATMILAVAWYSSEGMSSVRNSPEMATFFLFMMTMLGPFLLGIAIDRLFERFWIRDSYFPVRSEVDHCYFLVAESDLSAKRLSESDFIGKSWFRRFHVPGDHRVVDFPERWTMSLGEIPFDEIFPCTVNLSGWKLSVRIINPEMFARFLVENGSIFEISEDALQNFLERSQGTKDKPKPSSLSSAFLDARRRSRNSEQREIISLLVGNLNSFSTDGLGVRFLLKEEGV